MISKAVQDNHMLLKRLLPAHTVALLAEDLAECNNNGCEGSDVPHATRNKCRWGQQMEDVSSNNGDNKPKDCVYCAGGKCVLKKLLGAACGDDNNCQSDECHDNCSSECHGKV